jgi:hypothetical protein
MACPEILQVAGKVRQMAVLDQFSHVLDPTGLDVDKPHILAGVINLLIPDVVGTGVDVNPVPLLPQGLGELPDIDVHAPGILATQLP